MDHGKSTLADRLLEATGAIAAGGQAQVLIRTDSLISLSLFAWTGCVGSCRSVLLRPTQCCRTRKGINHFSPSLPTVWQYLDKLQVERERGITVKARPSCRASIAEWLLLPLLAWDSWPHLARLQHRAAGMQPQPQQHQQWQQLRHARCRPCGHTSAMLPPACCLLYAAATGYPMA